MLAYCICCFVLCFLPPPTLNFFCTRVSPISDVVVVSCEQWRDSAIHIRTSILPQTPLPSRLAHNTEHCDNIVLHHRTLLVIHFKYSSVLPCFLTAHFGASFILKYKVAVKSRNIRKENIFEKIAYWYVQCDKNSMSVSRLCSQVVY